LLSCSLKIVNNRYYCS